tara:strand:- start:2635 stop:3873 length:1239 start_codon:yes stop_codon:yes gene_type:complete
MEMSVLCRERLASLPRAFGLLEKVQKKGREDLIKQGEPKSKDESWKSTDLKRLERFLSLPCASENNEFSVEEFPFLHKSNKDIFQLNIDKLEQVSLPEGIKLLNKEEIELYLGNTVKLCKSQLEWPVLINEASAKDLVALKVKGKSLPTIELIFQAIPNSFNSKRILIVVEESSKLELIELIVGAKDSAQSNLIEIVVGKGSEVNHGIISLGRNDGSLMNTLAIEQMPLSHYSLTALHQGWHFSRFEPKIIQVNGEAKTTLKGLQISKSKEEIITHSFVRFDGPKGELDQLNKSVADEKSHSMFNGAIQVPKIAQKTQAAQLSRNLILSKRAKIDTKPELEIIADDVRCTHGATVSQLQEEELFYLKSRGIDAKKANALLLEGFYLEVLESLPLYLDRWSFLRNFLTRTNND